MTTWHWVRHGPTHEKNFVGWRDVPADLSDTARLARLDSHLPRPALLIASDLIRASATADAIGAGRSRLPDDPNLREFDFGDWDGRGYAEIARADPVRSRAYWETPGDIAPPNGESWNAAAERVSRAVDALNLRYPDADIVAVAHIGVIMTRIQRAEGSTPAQVIGHRIDNLSVTRLHHESGQWSVGVINHQP